MRLVSRVREVKKSLITRVVTGFLLVMFAALVFVFAALASPAHLHWFDFTNAQRGGFFAAFLFLTMVLAWLGGAEASRMIFKQRMVPLVLVLTCLTLIVLAPTVPYAIYQYGGPSFPAPELVMIEALVASCALSFVVLLVCLRVCGLLTSRNGLVLVFLVIWLGVFFFCLAYLALAKGWPTLLLGVLIPLLADSFAYFGGTFFGKHKMAPKISPKKTWEGAVCALVLTTGVIAAVLYGYQQDTYHQMFTSLFSADLSAAQVWPIIVCGAFALTAVSIAGDLLFSFIKRKYAIKDFSTIFPGHGGVLDRADSLSFVVIAYSLVIFIIAAVSVFYAAL